MEGISHEAASLAGHLRLGKLIYLYDDNHISIEGSTALAYTEDRVARFAAYGWHVQRVEDGNDLSAIEAAITSARNERERPSFIAVRTHIGYGSPHKQDTAAAHGEPLGAEELKLTKAKLEWPQEPAFYIPPEALKHFREAVERGREFEDVWQATLRTYESAHPNLARDWRRCTEGRLPDGWEKNLPDFAPDAKGLATRVSSGKILNALAPTISNLIGGSADLAPSTKTLIDGQADFQAESYQGRNLHFGVREHAMGGILNGMALHGGLIPYGATFLVFSDYMRPSIRLAALTKLKTIYVFTHDSIGLGEDGPTHQPIEHLASLRSIPNLTVIRPCDANETVQAWRVALSHPGGPVALVLTRQNLPTLDRSQMASAEGLLRGGYILKKETAQSPDVILIASGSEVHLALEASRKLEEKHLAVRLVSMASWELFDAQPLAYRQQVLPPTVKHRIAVEAASPQGWEKFVGDAGRIIGLNHFGASAPYQVVFEKFGLTASRIVEEALKLIG
jgi:transketolase